ncbi:hypothetical protein QBC40DRAFT_332041 [Triangularia verruculosa]|uniref:Uncharacterized protein n=1 Tax=Triangularia verruculosa TaxID=2587418 RepID=A0AAN6XCS0_9PEZI|nr:hypothetical protein QBC40DRAFT_332041 [Triangularia verruculosa]
MNPNIPSFFSQTWRKTPRKNLRPSWLTILNRIVNNNCRLLLPLPTTPFTPFSQIAAFLRTIRPQNNIYIHPRLLAFGSAEIRSNWKEWTGWTQKEDWDVTDTLGGFATVKRGEKNVLVALCTGYTVNWVSNNKYDPITETYAWQRTTDGDRKWHAYVIAFISNPAGKGKEMVVWDCDPEPNLTSESRIRDALKLLQRKLWDQLHPGGRFNIKAVWYQTDTRWSGADLCLTHSLQKMEEIAKSWDDGCFEADSDRRVRGFLRLYKR